MDERTGLGDADTDFARWLRQRIGRTKLQEVSRRAARRGIKVNASSLSTYLSSGKFPSPDLVHRLAAYFEVPPSEIETMRPAAEADAPNGVQRVPLDEMIGDLSKEVSQLRRVLTVGRRVEELGIDPGIARWGTPTVREVDVDDIPDEDSISASLRALERERYSEDRASAPMRLQLVTVSGSCQRPYIQPGDRVFIQPTSEFQRGDLVAVLYNGQMLLKRADYDEDQVLVLVTEDEGALQPSGEDQADVRGVYVGTFRRPNVTRGEWLKDRR